MVKLPAALFAIVTTTALVSCGNKESNQNVPQSTLQSGPTGDDSKDLGIRGGRTQPSTDRSYLRPNWVRFKSNTTVTEAELNEMNLPAANWQEHFSLIETLVPALSKNHCPNLDVDGNGVVENETVFKTEGFSNSQGFSQGDGQLLANYILRKAARGGGIDISLVASNATRKSSAAIGDYIGCLEKKKLLDTNSDGVINISDSIGILRLTSGVAYEPTLKNAEIFNASARVCMGYFKMNDVAGQSVGVLMREQIECKGAATTYRLPDARMASLTRSKTQLFDYEFSSEGYSTQLRKQDVSKIWLGTF
jgi:hypothetical protein